MWLLLEAEVCVFVRPRMCDEYEGCIEDVGIGDQLVRVDAKILDALDSVPHDLEAVPVVLWIDKLALHVAPH